MKTVITIEVESTDENAPLEDFLLALTTLLTWQWDNVAISSTTK